MSRQLSRQMSRQMKRAAKPLLALLLLLLLVISCRPAPTALPALKIDAITPARGSSAGGQGVTLSGESFFEVLRGRYPASLSVTVCGAPLTNLQVSGEVRSTVLPGGGSSSIRLGGSLSGVTTASATDASGDVIVRLPDGSQAVLPGAFECFDPAPLIASFALTPQPAALDQPARFSWQALDPAAGILECRLDAGDGSEPYLLAACQDLTGHEHTYAVTGEFTASLTVTAADGTQSSVTLPVSVLNRPPAAQPDAYATPAGTDLLVPAPGVLHNDTVNSGSVASGSLQGSAGGVLELAADGSFSYRPAAGFTGHETFSYELRNAVGSSDGVVTITVGEAPLAQDDSYLALQDEPLAVAAPGLLANDSLNLAVPDADPVSSQGGTVSLTPDGAFRYEPPAGFSGFDTFGYRLENGLATVAATVTIHVRLAPAAVDDLFTTPFETVLQVDAAAGLLGNDRGEPAPEVTAFDATSQGGATVSVNGDGSFSYTPASGFTGPDSFTYTAANGVGSDSTATVTIQVGIAPVAVADELTAISGEELTLPAPGVFANDELNAASLTVFTPSVQGGDVTLNGDGSLSYLPPPGFTGPDSFSYTLSNGMGDSTALVSVDVLRKPVAADLTFATPFGTPLSVPALQGLLAADVGVPASSVTAAELTAGSPGTLRVDPDGAFGFTPAEGFTGYATFDYTISNGVGGPVSASVTIRVSEAPVAVADSYDMYVDENLQIQAPGVLGNDTVNGATLSLASQSVNGTASLEADGSFTYQPGSNFGGQDSFAYTLSNALGSATATVTINVNYPGAPEAQDDEFDTLVDEPLSEVAPGLFVNDARNGGQLSAFDAASLQGGVSSVEADGAFSYAPPPGFTGQDSFTYQLSNPEGNSTATVTINVRQPVQASDDSFETALDTPLLVAAASGLLANDTGAPRPVVVGHDDSGIQGEVQVGADGSFTYTPDAGFTGYDSFGYTADNSVNMPSTALVTIRVGAEPEAQADGPFEAVQDGVLELPEAELLANDDVQGSNLSLPAGSEQGGTLTYGEGVIRYAPASGFVGEDAFTYTLTNGLGTATARVTLSVYRQVTTIDYAYQTGLDVVLVVPAPGLLADADGLPAPTVTNYGAPVSGQVSGTADGGFTYTPAPGYTGVDSFSYAVGNGYGSDATATVSVTVGEEPVARDDDFEATVGTILSVAAAEGILGNDDVNGATLVEPNPAGSSDGTLTLMADGSFTYTPAVGFWGEETFTYTLKNGLGESDATVTFEVYLEPTVQDHTYTTPLDTTLQVGAAEGVLSGHSGRPEPTVTLLTDADSIKGTLVLQADGSFSFTPEPDFTGEIKFDYEARNGRGDDTATVTIFVGEPAVATDDGPFEVLGNVSRSSLTYSVLGNDTGDRLKLDLVAFDGESKEGGDVTLNSDGTFTYDPPAGFQGEDSFEYTVSNGFGPSKGTVSLNVSGMLWFVDPDADEEAANPGNGRLSRPFTSLQELHALEERTPGTILLYATDVPQAGPLTLRPAERLIGQSTSGSLASLAGVTVPEGSAELPELLGSAGPAVIITVDTGGLKVNSNNRLQGFMLSGGPASSSSTALQGSNIGTLQVTDVSIGTQGNALDLTGGTLQGVFPSLFSNGGSQGIRLADLAGSLALTGNLTSQTGGLLINGGSLTVSFAGDISGVRPLTVQDYSGSVTVTGEVSGGSVLLQDSTRGTVRVGSLDLAAQDAVALSMRNSGKLLLDDPAARIRSYGETAVLLTDASELDLSNAVISSTGSSCVSLIAGASSRQSFSLTNSTVSECTVGVQLAAVRQGVADVTLSNNRISNGTGSGISLHAEDSALISAWVTNNIVTSTLPGNNGFGIDVVAEEGGWLRGLITGNTVSNFAFGLRTGVRGAGTGTADVMLTGNTVSSGGSWAGPGAWFLAGTAEPGERGRLCVNLTGGNSIRSGDSTGPDYLLDQYSESRLMLQGFAGGDAAAFIGQYDPGVTASVNPGAVVDGGMCNTP